MIKHVGSTIEVCLTAMTIWKSFIVRESSENDPHSLGWVNKSDFTPSRSSSDEQTGLISYSSVSLARLGCMLESSSFHTSEFFYQPDGRFFSNVRDRGEEGLRQQAGMAKRFIIQITIINSIR